jgi:hypothetical protein
MTIKKGFVMFTAQTSWKKVLYWYAAMVLLCAIGTFLAYKSPLSSEAWVLWSGEGAWKRDTMRAIVSSLLSIFVLWNLEILPAKPYSTSRPTWSPLRRHEWKVVALILLVLGVSNFYFLPESFIGGLIEREINVPHTFRQIMVPYFPYFLYVMCFWLGIVTPAFVCLLRRMNYDLEWWKGARQKLYDTLSRQRSLEELTTSTFQELLASFQGYVIGLKNVAERYLPVLLAMSLALLHEQLTAAHKTATSTAVEAAKGASWLFLGPALLMFVALVALGYQSAVKKAEAGFSPYIDMLVESPNEKNDVLSSFLVLRTNLIWQESPLTFIITAVKSASVAIPLLLAVTAYVLKSVIDQTAWPSIFLPSGILSLLKDLYA